MKQLYLLHLLFVLILSLISLRSYAFDISVVHVRATGNANTIVIPIKRVKNLIIIEARIDTVFGNFILDTGTPCLVLNGTYFRHAWSTDEYASNATGHMSTPVRRTSVRNLSIRELHLNNLVADLSDLGHIENYRNIKILGLLGVSLFTSYEMVIDLYHDVIYLNKPGMDEIVPEKDKPVKSPIFKVPFTLTHDIITVETTIAEKKLVFCLDTGAETNALSKRLPRKVMQTFNVTKRLPLLGTGGSRAEVLLGTVDEITVGGKSFKKMHAAITDLDELGYAYGRPIHGILGNNFLVKGVVSINFVKKELCMYSFILSP